MNLGNRRIKNPELKAEFERLGFSAVATFRASGNVIFEVEKGAEATIQKRVEAGLERGLGYDVPVFLRDAEELAAIAAQRPFAPSRLEASKGKLQVLLLAKKPSAKVRGQVLDLGPQLVVLDPPLAEVHAAQKGYVALHAGHPNASQGAFATIRPRRAGWSSLMEAPRIELGSAAAARRRLQV